MFDKIITFFLNSEKSLNQFNQKTRSEVEKYSNKQVKKAVAICFIVGVLVGASLIKVV